MAKRPFDLPALNLIEGFEASARHSSFTKAANELFLTQSAVSRQIQSLEEQLGVQLFERRPRGLVLTSAGTALYGTIVEVLRKLDQTTRQIRGQSRLRSITLTTTPAFAALWLIPRLAGFTREHPEVDVRISASVEIVDLERSGIDLAVRYSGPLAVPGERLFAEEVMPVCAPSLLRDPKRPLNVPEDLRKHVLLHYDDPRRAPPSLDWSTWLQSVGQASLKTEGALYFNQYDQVILGAVAGQGVALGRMPLIRRFVRSHKLVAPFAPKIVASRGYYVIESPQSARNLDLKTFVSWLRSEAAGDARRDAGVAAASR